MPIVIIQRGDEGFTGATPEDRTAYVDYRGWESGENVATGYLTDKAVFEGWKNSPAHYDNMMNPQHTEMAYAKVQKATGNREWMYCMILGAKYVSGSTGSEDVTVYRPIPISMGEGLIDGDFEVKEYNHSINFDEVFEMSYHNGIITEITEPTVSVEVTIETGDGESTTTTFTNVEVFYHCPNVSNTEEGVLGFMVEDEVIVLNEGGGSPGSSDLSVVGHKNKLNLCTVGRVVLVSNTSESEAFAWDVDNDRLIGEFGTLAEVLEYLDQVLVSTTHTFASYSERIITHSPSSYSSEHWHPGHNLPKYIPSLQRTAALPHGYPSVPTDFAVPPTVPYGRQAPHGIFPSRNVPLTDQLGDGFNFSYDIIQKDILDPGDYKSSYLVKTGGDGKQENFDDIHTMDCTTGGNEGFGNAWVAFNYVPYQEVYFHSMFFSEALKNEAMTYENCHENLELVLDTWDAGTEWDCMPAGYHYGFRYDRDIWIYGAQHPAEAHETADANIVDIWFTDIWPADWTGPIPKLTACWLDSGIVTLTSPVDFSMAFEFIRIGHDVRMDDETTIINDVQDSGYRFMGKLFAKKSVDADSNVNLLIEALQEARLTHIYNYLVTSSALRFTTDWEAIEDAPTLWELPEMEFNEYIHQEGYLLYTLKSGEPTVVTEADLWEEVASIGAPTGTMQMFRIVADMTDYGTMGLRRIYLSDGTFREVEATQLTFEDVVDVFMTKHSGDIDRSTDEVGVGVLQGENGLTYMTIFFTFRQHKWTGFYPVKTASMLEYARLNFTYNDIDELKLGVLDQTDE